MFTSPAQKQGREHFLSNVDTRIVIYGQVLDFSRVYSNWNLAQM